ncbi:MAG TPA: hypothetical protein VNZ44_11180, partial [Pyrinomonadaceae bacterium]|nr:hypothetical protein [Pyrinomonadaceae bacterium]
MVETIARREEQRPTREERRPARDLTLPQSGIVTAVLTLLFIALFSFLAVREQQPPPAADASAPPTEFSAARALKHVEQIAQRPHPVGSQEHQRVQEYIFDQLSALGVEAQVQEAEVMSPFQTSVTLMAKVKNVVARLKGSGGGGKAL